VVEFMSYLNNVECNFCLRVNQLSRNNSVRHFFAVVSKLGDGGYWVLLTILTIWLQGAAAIAPIMQMWLTAAAGVLVYKSLKNSLVRERPYMNHLGIYCGTAPLDRYSFPSGHTLHAASFTTMLIVIEPLLAIVAVPFALLVAVSRVVLGLHYPSDVIVGAAIGISLGSTSFALF